MSIVDKIECSYILQACELVLHGEYQEISSIYRKIDTSKCSKKWYLAVSWTVVLSILENLQHILYFSCTFSGWFSSGLRMMIKSVSTGLDCWTTTGLFVSNTLTSKLESSLNPGLLYTYMTLLPKRVMTFGTNYTYTCTKAKHWKPYHQNVIVVPPGGWVW